MTDTARQPATERRYWPTDGWREAFPEDHGLDSKQLNAARDHLSVHVPHMDSLLVVRGGYLVFEHYDRGDARTLRNVKSVTKSVTSALIGIALSTGDLDSIDELIGHLLPETFATVDDRRKRDITLRDLLTMRSGLEWAEYGADTVQMTTSPNWVQYVLGHALIRTPGTEFNYSTGDTQLLAAVLGKQTEMSALDYADLYLFGPLGITQRTWPADPQGINVGGAELALTSRDMAKFGYLYLNRGVWDGAQIIPETWIDESHVYHTMFDPASGAECDVLGYGFLWWLRPQGDADSAIAVGFGGQFVYVIPALDMVVVMTGRLGNVPEAFRDNRMLCQFNLVEDFIVPAVQEA